jgi:hypothetical protein
VLLGVHLGEQHLPSRRRRRRRRRGRWVRRRVRRETWACAAKRPELTLGLSLETFFAAALHSGSSDLQ